MDTFDFEMACLFCQRALDVESDNLQALDMQGHIYSELGNTQKAKEISFMQDPSCPYHLKMIALCIFESIDSYRLLNRFFPSFSACSGVESR